MSAVFEGPAILRVKDSDHGVRVRLTGHIDPVDGRYHWRGMVFGWTPGTALRLPQQVSVCIDGRTATGHLTEVTPWGTHCVAGVGAPPFAMAGVD